MAGRRHLDSFETILKKKNKTKQTILVHVRIYIHICNAHAYTHNLPIRHNGVRDCVCVFVCVVLFFYFWKQDKMKKKQKRGIDFGIT